MIDKTYLLMPFLDEGENFTNGFECGQLWEKMSKDEVITSKLVHSVNCNQIELMCEHFGYEYEMMDCLDGCWHYLTCKPIDINQFKT
jgi:hypothetical protein